MSRRIAKRLRPSLTQKRLDAVLKYVDDERSNLCRAITLLGCLAVALKYDENLQTGHCYYDIAQMALELVNKSMDALDCGNLPEAPQ